MYTIYPPLEMIRFWQEEARERRRQRGAGSNSVDEKKRAKKRPARTPVGTSEDA